MVNGINGRPVRVSDAIAPVARTAAPAPVARVTTPQPQVQVAALAKSVAAAPPVDAERVARIKSAIANGTFPILPATIADQMMAFRYEWMAHDQA